MSPESVVRPPRMQPVNAAPANNISNAPDADLLMNSEFPTSRVAPAPDAAV
jgi:hypothetical protein